MLSPERIREPHARITELGNPSRFHTTTFCLLQKSMKVHDFFSSGGTENSLGIFLHRSALRAPNTESACFKARRLPLLAHTQHQQQQTPAATFLLQPLPIQMDIHESCWVPQGIPMDSRARTGDSALEVPSCTPQPFQSEP